MTGCATLNNITATENVLINQAFTIGAEVYISKAGGTVTPPALYSPEQQARAQSVKTIAVEIQGFASGKVTVAQLDTVLAAWALKLKTPVEQTLAQGLIVEVNVLLATRITTGAINAAESALVTELMQDWITAATAYGAT
jgi:hypothetical protein